MPCLSHRHQLLKTIQDQNLSGGWFLLRKALNRMLLINKDVKVARNGHLATFLFAATQLKKTKAAEAAFVFTEHAN